MMNRQMAYYLGFLGILILASGAQSNPTVSAKQAWQGEYAGEEIQGKQVLACWQFGTNAPARDVSGNGHDLKLRGQSAFAPEGRFGSCLETFATGTNDKPNGAQTTNIAGLTPEGAFTIEMWIKPKPEIAKITKAFLLDKIPYGVPPAECQRDYSLTLRADKNGEFHVEAVLGFGDGRAVYSSNPCHFVPENWHHIAFTYDGRGTGTIFKDGGVIGSGSFTGRLAVAAGKSALVIGDRGCSKYDAFPGFIDQVRICNGVIPFTPADASLNVSVAAMDRTSFIRMEKGKGMELTVNNNLVISLSNAKLAVTLEDEKRQELNRESLAIPEIAARESKNIDYALDTSVRPGSYNVKVQVLGPDKVSYSREEVFPVVIVPRPMPLVMPVVMWQDVKVMDEQKFQMAKDIGFTMSIDSPSADYAHRNTVEESKRMLNYVLAHDFKVAGHLYPGLYLGLSKDKKFCRIDRTGKLYGGNDICGLFEEAQKYCYDFGATFATNYAHFPGLGAVLIHSELVDCGTKPCFHEHDKSAFRKAAGIEIPEQATYNMGGVDFRASKECPFNRVVPDDFPVLKYCQWFWKDGNGWNNLHSQVHRGLKSTGGNTFWTWYDPAIRYPHCYGNGGEVDVISEWTYSYPDPIKLGMATDELFAMQKGGRAGQQVMSMTQAIWYRSKTAPKSEPGVEDNVPKTKWEESQTDAKANFITIAPDHLREAFWSKISRPVQGIMYHGWQSLVDCTNAFSYRYTNPETKEVLKELTHTVVQPLGPMLLQVPDRPADVAMLQSFTAQMMLSKYANDTCHLILQYAQFQPEIVYDQTILQYGLDPFKVLVLPGCDLLTASVVKKVNEFQARGGIIVGDENLCPAIKPDIVLTRFMRQGGKDKAQENKAAMLAKAGELRKQLDSVYQHPSDSSNPEVITRLRRYGSTDYLFVVNDYREYGDYVGHHRLVMEKGIPSKAKISVKRNDGQVYDLVKGQAVNNEAKQGRVEFEVELGPGGGGIYMLTDKAIDGVKVTLPKKARPGESIACSVDVVDSTGKLMQGAVIPVQVQIRDSTGKEAEYSGYYGAKDGALIINLDIARNELPGEWHILARELASGKTTETTLAIVP